MYFFVTLTKHIFVILFLTSRYAHWVIIFSFIGTIILGALLLHMPGMLSDGALSWTDSFFMSTSAACVTGTMPLAFDQLSVVGQGTMAVLIQIGGVGLATLLVVAALLFARSGLQWHALAMQVFETMHFSKIKGLIKTIIMATLIIEFFGALFLYSAAWYYSLPLSFFHACIQAINLFCNAGFIISGPAHEVVATRIGLLIGSAIILLGSMGFLVIFECFEYINAKRTGKIYVFSATSRIAFHVYAFTALVAFFVLLSASYPERGLIDGICWSFFNAFSLRSCGMIDPHVLSTFSSRMTLFVIMYSFMGGAPLSTSSGLKSSIIGILFAVGRMLFRGWKQILIYGRSIASDSAIKSLFYVIYVGLITIVLASIIDFVSSGECFFMKIFVESAGMISNSGISYGIMENFSFDIKYFLMIGMIIGRIGVLIFIFGASVRLNKDVVKYPEDRLALL